MIVINTTTILHNKNTLPSDKLINIAKARYGNTSPCKQLQAKSRSPMATQDNANANAEHTKQGHGDSGQDRQRGKQ